MTDTFFELVRDYFQRAARASHRHVMVDATLPLNDVVEQCWKAIAKYILPIYSADDTIPFDEPAPLPLAAAR